MIAFLPCLCSLYLGEILSLLYVAVVKIKSELKLNPATIQIRFKSVFSDWLKIILLLISGPDQPWGPPSFHGLALS
jgi:hypothetical protein